MQPIVHPAARSEPLDDHARSSGGWRRPVSWVLASVAISVLGAVVLCASAWLHLQGPVGRRALGDMMSAGFSSQIPGELEIAGVSEARLPIVRAARVTASTPSGREVMALRDVMVDIDVLGSLQNRGFVARRVRVGGGALHITDSPNGRSWIERAFHDDDDGSEPQASAEPPSDTLVLRLRDTRFEALDVHADMADTTARLTNASGRTRIWLRRSGDIQLRFWSVRGRLRTSLPLLSEGTVRGLALTIDPSGPSLARFATRLDALGGRLTLAGHAPARSGEGARLCVWTGGAFRASLAGIGAELVTSIASPIRFDMRTSEPPPRPRCEEES